MRKNKKFIDPRYFMDEKMELNEGATWGGSRLPPKQPRELGLPNDIGTPEKLLAGVEKILKNPELSSGQSKSQIDASTAADIVKHINSKLKENPPDQGTIKRLQDAKRTLQTMHGGESTADKRATSSKIHQTQRDFAAAGESARRHDPQARRGIGERKLSKSQLKQIINEELETLIENSQEQLESIVRNYNLGQMASARKLLKDLWNAWERLVPNALPGDPGAIAADQAADAIKEVFDDIADKHGVDPQYLYNTALRTGELK